MTIENTGNSEQDQLNSDLEANTNSETKAQIPNETAENSETETEINLEQDEPQPYTEVNLELESFLTDATTTQEEVKQQNREDKAKAKEQEYLQAQQFSPEKAAGYAVKFVGGAIGAVREQTGKDIQIKPFQAQIAVTLFVPIIMKYGHVVENYMKNATEGVDENSNMPEYLAGAGLLGMAGVLWSQSRKAPPIPKDVANAEA